MTPKEDASEKKRLAHGSIKAELEQYLKDSTSPERPSFNSRQIIKPYLKNESQAAKKKVDYSDPMQVKKAFEDVLLQTIEKTKKD